MCSVYWLLILRDQLVVGSLELIYLVAASGHNYIALIRQGGLNPLTVKEVLEITKPQGSIV